MFLSIVIPAFNDGACLGDTIEKIYTFFAKRADFKLEVIVVDDCSADDTPRILAGLLKRFMTLTSLRNEKNMGKGFSVKRGVLKASGDYVLFMDTDLSTPIDQFDILWKNIVNADIVIASRALPESVILKHQTKIKENVAKMGNKLIRICLRLPFRDTQCGFKLFSRNAIGIFRYQTIDRWGFDMELLFIAKKDGYNIAEVPICWTNDPTSLVKKKDYFIVLIDIFKILVNNVLGRYNSSV